VEQGCPGLHVASLSERRRPGYFTEYLSEDGFCLHREVAVLDRRIVERRRVRLNDGNSETSVATDRTVIAS